jgi:hypothetical protein
MNIEEAQWRRGADDPAERQALQTRLLFAALYTLLPIGAEPPAWQLWRHPSGLAVVPCFLSEASAMQAALEAHAQVVRAAGRDLFATLEASAAWVDPHGTPVLLSSGQIRALLASDPEPPAVARDSKLEGWSAAHDLPQAVAFAWNALLPTYPHVTAAYWLGQSAMDGLERCRLVLVTTDAQENPRTLDGLAAALRANYAGSLRIEAQALIEGELPDAHEQLVGVEPFYIAPADQPLRLLH